MGGQQVPFNELEPVEGTGLARAVPGSRQHRGVDVDSRDLVSSLCQRHADSAGPDAKLQDRPARPPG